MWCAWFQQSAIIVHMPTNNLTGLSNGMHAGTCSCCVILSKVVLGVLHRSSRAVLEPPNRFLFHLFLELRRHVGIVLSTILQVTGFVSELFDHFTSFMHRRHVL